MPCFLCGVCLKPLLGSLGQGYTVIVLMDMPKAVTDVSMGYMII